MAGVVLMALILVVEDSGYQRGQIRNAIKGEGREIIEAPNAEEGLKLAASRKPDIILSDIVMPGMSGIEMLEQLKRDGVKVPVVIVSADMQDPTRKECMNLGAVGFILKPLTGDSLTTLKNILNEHLG